MSNNQEDFRENKDSSVDKHELKDYSLITTLKSRSDSRDPIYHTSSTIAKLVAAPYTLPS
jgi:hypothetical protein